jgi:succinate dehydrogenase/fumarate reductase flavoprotein subunit
LSQRRKGMERGIIITLLLQMSSLPVRKKFYDLEKILDRLPTMYEQFKNIDGIDIFKEKMEVAPTAHYSMAILMGISGNETLIIPGDIIYKRGQIKGSMANDRQHLYEALDYVAKGKVKVMTAIFSLENVNDAYDKVSKGEVRFRAVIKPKS